MTILPAGSGPMVTSKKTRGRLIVLSAMTGSHTGLGVSESVRDRNWPLIEELVSARPSAHVIVAEEGDDLSFESRNVLGNLGKLTARVLANRLLGKCSSFALSL